MENKDIASKVLDYWFAIEFLGQDSYDMCTDEKKLTRDMAKFKKSDPSEKQRRKQIFAFDKLKNDDDIYHVITSQARDCGMSTWGNLTFFIGRVRRQTCIEQLAKKLGVELEQAEKNTEYIPVLSFQCNNQGKFIDHSLSLSTIVWSLSQISDKTRVQISKLLSEEKYNETLEELEKRYFNVGDADLSAASDEFQNQEIKKETPVFEIDAVTMSKINDIYNNICSLYAGFIGKAIEENNTVKYQLFKDSRAKDKYDDDNYMGLSQDFFSSDIKMVKNNIEEKKYDFNSGMLSDLISYICAPHNGFVKKSRHDFITPKDEDTLESEMSEILNICNAPIAKWPSRYMPALMQQVAVNFAISNRTRGIFSESGKIFSVNGPPGTGKTTLLKEIIASNIVEKAILLSQYETPDDAFEGVKFEKGAYTGAYVAPVNGYPVSPYPKWFKFKDEHITDYGVLVTSCNNAAVENITKELPLGSDMLDSLKGKTDGADADSEEMQKQLGEIRKLFSAKETEDKVEIYKKDGKRHGEYPEIYFTGYAQQFLASGDDKSDVWGLIAAPLGKKSNINSFYYDVLNPVWQDFMMSNQSLTGQLPHYKKAREKFIEQLGKVRSIQSKLSEYGYKTLRANQAKVHSNEVTKNNYSLISSNSEKQDAIDKEIVEAQNLIEKDAERLSDANSACTQLDKSLHEFQENIRAVSNQELEYRRLATEAENSVSFLTKIFRKSKYNAALELARAYRERAEDCMKNISELSVSVKSVNAQAEKALTEKEQASQKLKADQIVIKNLTAKRDAIEKETLKLQHEIETAKQRNIDAQTEKEVALEEFTSAGELKTGLILDDAFIKKVLSDDKSMSTDAQTSNPWTTENYNREREKLFFMALQLTKYFLLSSKCCRANLCILGQYWGLRTETGTERIKFHPDDKEQMIGSLFNTLFLLAPVISSTFASVGRLLRDIKEPGAIGTLIIDEAGQAQPQMAVGALYRSRRSIIIGDPKQVEPVVTDDLKLLKEAYSEPLYANYKKKSLSTQSCADIINPFGTFFENGTNSPEWVGCPLFIHRRCISPMYEISNKISYNGIMKQKTLPPSDSKTNTFIASKSQWINTGGTENGGGDHFVTEQGNLVCKMVDAAFKKAIYPDIYIISPFTSVVSGIRRALGTFANRNKNSALGKSAYLGDWLYTNIGTVHKFQGKEANEVIFVLGCDEMVKERYAVKGFVNSNIVNVAATRAKYRFYIIGNMKVWCNNQFVREAKSIIDTLPIENITEINSWEDSEEKNIEILNQAAQLPGATSFVMEVGENEGGKPEYDIDSDEFISTIDEANFLNKDLSEDQYRQFGFSSKSDFERLPTDVKKNLLMGMKLYYLLKPVYTMSPNLDASCCGILFCKGMELYLRENFVRGLKARFPDYSIKNASNRMIELQNARDTDFMIGTIQYILRNKSSEIGAYMILQGESALAPPWWDSFNEKLKLFAGKRNKCCHPQWFKWQDMKQLLGYEFEEDGANVARNPKIGGVFYESEKGQKLDR